MAALIATTTNGQVTGLEDGGVLQFRGIPFADAPVGPLRFRAPQPPLSWEGVRDATGYGTTSLQNLSPLTMMFGGEPEPMGRTACTSTWPHRRSTRRSGR